MQQNNQLERTIPEMMEQKAKPIPTTASDPPWNQQKFPDIAARIPGIEKKETLSDAQLKALTLEHIESNFPPPRMDSCLHRRISD